MSEYLNRIYDETFKEEIVIIYFGVKTIPIHKQSLDIILKRV